MKQSQERYLELAETAVSKGLIKKLSQNTFGMLNLSLYPYVSTQYFYDKLTQVVGAWQKLTFQASKDCNFLANILEEMAKTDEWAKFISRIYNGSKKTINKSQLVFQRYDFMTDKDNIPKILEYNFIAVGLSFFTKIIQESHQLFYHLQSQSYVQSKACDEFVNEVQRHYKIRNLKGMLIILASDQEGNCFTELKYFEVGFIKAGIKVRTAQLKELLTSIHLDESNDLFHKGELVSFVFFRHGFNTRQYLRQLKSIQDGIKIRVMLADSNATCIPDIAHEIVNMKRVQCELSKPEVMRRYLTEEESKLVESSLVPIFEFSNIKQEIFKQILERVKENPSDWVLKPNKQGGSNNIFGKDIVPILLNTTLEQLKGYILQQRIHSQYTENYSITTQLKLFEVRCNYEIGRFGIVSVIDGVEQIKQNCGYSVFTHRQGQNQSCIIGAGGKDSFSCWKIKKNQ